MPQRMRQHLDGDRSIEMRRSGGPATSRPARRVVRRRRATRAVASCVDPQVTPSTRPELLAENVGAARFVSVLLGMAVAVVAIGLAIRLRGPFANSGLRQGFLPRTVVGTALILLALGVRVPQRIAWWECVHAWQRFLLFGRSSRMSNVLLTTTHRERPLYWVILSVVALGGGVVVGLLPVGTRVALLFYDWMLIRFLWSDGSIAMLQAAIVFAIGLLPLPIMGFAFSAVHHLSCPYGRWEPRTATWLMIGAASGTVIAVWIASGVEQGNLLMVAAAIPVLVVALVSAMSTGAREPGTEKTKSADTALLPIWTDQWSVLVRVSAVLVGGGSAYAAALWGKQIGEGGVPVGIYIPLLLLAIALGIAAGCRTRRTSLRSIGGFGMACVAAGAILAVGSAAFCRSVASSSGSALVLAFATILGLGFAAAYGQQALLNRVANRSVVGASTLAQTLVCAALLVWFGEPVAEHMVGRLPAFILLVLCLLGLGGVLIIYEPNYSLRSRRIRLCAIFACIGTMIAILGPLR